MREIEKKISKFIGESNLGPFGLQYSASTNYVPE
jgi:hypothetical protein